METVTTWPDAVAIVAFLGFWGFIAYLAFRLIVHFSKR